MQDTKAVSENIELLLAHARNANRFLVVGEEKWYSLSISIEFKGTDFDKLISALERVGGVSDLVSWGSLEMKIGAPARLEEVLGDLHGKAKIKQHQEALSLLLVELGISQTQLAKKIGISPSIFSMVNCGKRRLPKKVVAFILLEPGLNTDLREKLSKL